SFSFSAGASPPTLSRATRTPKTRSSSPTSQVLLHTGDRQQTTAPGTPVTRPSPPRQRQLRESFLRAGGLRALRRLRPPRRAAGRCRAAAPAVPPVLPV